MALTDKLTAEKAGLESYLDSARGAKLEQSQIERLEVLNSLLGANSGGGGGGSITNYATETGGNLASINTKLPASLGVKTAANSFSVAPASDANFPITTETGLLTYRTTALTNTAVAVKATGGSVRGWNFVNVNTSAVYVKLYDIAAGSVTVGTSPVIRTIAIPAGSPSNPAIFFLEAQPTSQEDFLIAISMACVTGLADNSNTAPSTAIHASVRYK